ILVNFLGLGAQKADVTGSDISPALKIMDANRAQLESTQFAATAGALVGGLDTRDGALEVMQQCASLHLVSSASYSMLNISPIRRGELADCGRGSLSCGVGAGSLECCGVGSRECGG